MGAQPNSTYGRVSRMRGGPLVDAVFIDMSYVAAQDAHLMDEVGIKS